MSHYSKKLFTFTPVFNAESTSVFSCQRPRVYISRGLFLSDISLNFDIMFN
jgi:hypothetical protein